MRSTTGSIQRYSPEAVPADASQLPAFLTQELLKLQNVINNIVDGNLEVTTVAPAKPRDGMLRRADGTNWNPGSGAGVYCYYGAAWHYLG